MSRTLRLLGPALAVVLVAGLAPSSAGSLPQPAPSAAADPQPGAAGIGDAYWPLDGNGGIDVRHYDVGVRYDFATGRLSGTTTLTLRATADLSRFNLDLLLAASSVTVDGVRAAFSKPSGQGGHELQVTPAAPLARGQEVEVAVAYAGVPGDLGYAGEMNWLASDDEVVTQNEPHMAPWWFAANDHPADKATFDVTVTGPATHQVVSNGLPVSRTVSDEEATATTHWRATDPMATYLAFFALGRYDVARSTRGGLPSYVAVSRGLFPRDRQEAMTALQQSDEITARLAGWLGPYPFESTGGLSTALYSGFALENQTRPIYHGTSVLDESLLVHELAHQWFGDSVSLRRWRDIWLNEGFATFMEVVHDERVRGRPAQRWLREKHRAYSAIPRFWRVDLTDPGRARVFDAAVYHRGAMALQALRHRIGGADFWRLLRTWLRERRHGHGTIGSFRTLAERTAGHQLDGFFRAWLQDPRPPAVTRRNGLR